MPFSLPECPWHSLQCTDTQLTLDSWAFPRIGHFPDVPGASLSVVPRWFLGGCSMDGKRITKRLVDSLNATDGEYFVWDNKLPGFGLRVQPSGVMSYVAKYRAGSGRAAPTRRVTLGRVGKVTPDEAEKLAKRVLGAVAHGADPAAAKSADRRAATLKELADLFLVDHVAVKRKAATADHYSRHSRKAGTAITRQSEGRK